MSNKYTNESYWGAQLAHLVDSAAQVSPQPSAKKKINKYRFSSKDTKGFIQLFKNIFSITPQQLETNCDA